MATRVLGPTGSRRRRRFLFVPILVVAAAALLLVGAAQAVHDENFQLDGNTAASSTTSFGGHTQNFDWDSFFNSSGNPIFTTFPDPLVPGFTASGFDRDFNTTANGSYDTGDASTYTQGSKDIDNVSSWVCTAAQNVTNKGDIQNAYAVSYTDPVTGHQFLYFAQERNSNNGTANVAFWFLQDPTADCDASNGTTNFTGNHTDGDLFVVSTFTNGGVVSTINAYKWVGGAGGSLNPNAVASGGDCTATTPPAPLGDPSCATVNKQTITGIPWLTNNNGKTNGLGHSLLTAEFFEGGVDLTQSGLADKCFNTFVANTRSSAEFTATLYDFSRGSLGECKSETKTTPTPAAGSETIIPATAQVTASDSAEIKVTGVSKFDGTVKFSLCGPLALASTANCQTGGVDISTTTLDDATSPATVGSGNVTLTKVGKYCWRAEYSGDSVRGVPGSSDPANSATQTECFKITPRTPTLTTCAGTYNATTGACEPTGTVNFGQPVTDRAKLGNTANQPGTGGLGDGSINPTGGNGPAQGTITFTLYKANCTTLATGTGTNPQSVNVSGNNTYGPVNFTPDAPGTYHWVASYSGDSPNTNGTSHNSACTNTDEDVIVRRVTPVLSTRQFVYPQDKAVITCSPASDCSASGAGNLDGTVTFKLYDTLANCQANGTTGLLFGPDPHTISGAAPQPATTNNTVARVAADATVAWRVTYTSNTQVHTDASPSACTETTAVDFTGDDGNIAIP
jgi:hypothetical protein